MYSSNMGSIYQDMGPGGVLGWVLDRDAEHRLLTRNATKGEKRGVETIHFAKFWQKVGVEIRHFPHFCSKIGVETIQIFQRPEIGGSKWRSICSNLHRVSTLPGDMGLLKIWNFLGRQAWKIMMRYIRLSYISPLKVWLIKQVTLD